MRCFRIALLAIALLGGTRAIAQVQLRPREVAANLAQPVAIVSTPVRPNLLFIVEQGGTVRILDMSLSPPLLYGAPFLNIGQSAADAADRLTTASGERGLLGLAFDPNFAANGYIYVNYTTLGSAGSFFTRIDRFTVIGSPATSTGVDTSTRITLVQYIQDFTNHNGGDIEFGPDGMLYVSSGDGGSANDPNERGQNLDSMLGKILRLDVTDASSADGDGVYVPNDNPFRAAGGAVRPYVWAFGVRNPWRMHFDRELGDLYIGDVGQDYAEEINFQPKYIQGPGGNAAQVAGRNYGWDCREGIIAAPGNPSVDPDPDFGCDAAAGGYVDPIKQYLHTGDNACSITGGVVYRGTAIPELAGAYFHADYCGQWVRSFRVVAGALTDLRDWTAQLNIGTGAVNGIVAWGLDAQGEMYFASINLGRVYQVIEENSACGCPCTIQTQDTLVFSDSFDTNQGWTIVAGSPAANDGLWQRAQPVPSPQYSFDPLSDSDGNGWCFVTENSDPGTATTSDVDNGSTILLSPNLDFLSLGGGQSGGNITICFDYYVNLSQTGGANPDGLFMEISSNGTAGPWTRLATLTASNGNTWLPFIVTQNTLNTSGVTNSASMRVRFIASDNASPGQSTVECGVDAFKIYRQIPITDCNNNSVPDDQDILLGSSADCNANNIPDECDIAAAFFDSLAANDPNLRIDLDGGPIGSRTAGAALFNANCFGCHAANGTGGTGPNIRNKDRYIIQRRLYLLDFHPGGGFPGSTAQDHADLEAFLSDTGSSGRPDGLIDACQSAFPNCDADSVPDGRELELGTQLDRNFNGAPDACECLCDVDGTPGVAVSDIFAFLSIWFANFGSATGPFPPGDFDFNNAVEVADIFAFLNCWFQAFGNPCP